MGIMNSHPMSKALLAPVFLRLWILVHVASMVCVVQGASCSQNLGECGRDCVQRCTSMHPGGEGSCETIGVVTSCTCYWECPSPPKPPKPKTCYADGGSCNTECWNDCCNQKCGLNYKSGTGFCNDIGVVPVPCQCEYPC